MTDRDRHLLALAKECIKRLRVDDNFGYGLTMDGKRPFGSSGTHQVLVDTLEIAGVKYDPKDENAYTEALDYAGGLWSDLPAFLRKHVDFTFVKQRTS